MPRNQLLMSYFEDYSEYSGEKKDLNTETLKHKLLARICFQSFALKKINEVVKRSGLVQLGISGD